MKLNLTSIQLTAKDLADVAARYASSQELYSPTAPRPPVAEFGWRDRWWLNQTASQQVAIHYWFFALPDEARTAADEGRLRLSARTVSKFGGHESIYQPPLHEAQRLGDAMWQAGANFLFVRHTVIVLVAEVGGQVSVETTRRIACKVLQKIEGAL